MYCPRCGHQTVSDELRFCSFCGFKLGVVKATLADSDEVPPSDKSVPLPQPRQRDINAGVILMFAGVLLVSWMAGSTGLGLGRGVGAIVLSIVYLALLFLSRPITKAILKLLSLDEGTNLSTSQKGFGFGATLMFLSTVVLAISSFLFYGRMKTTPLFIGVGLTFAFLLLIGRYLMRGLQLFFQNEPTGPVSRSSGAVDQTARLERGFDGPSLPPAQGTPVSLFATQKATTSEIVAPSSITEHTTNLLESK